MSELPQISPPLPSPDGTVVLAIMQPYVFPYLSYFQLMRSVNTFVPYAAVNYRKQGWVNRNRILTREHGPIYLTVPLRQKSSFRRIADIELDDSTHWRRHFLKVVRHSYARRPFFEETYPLVEEVMLGRERRLGEFNSRCILSTALHLGMDTDLVSGAAFSEIEALMTDVDSALAGPLRWISLEAPSRKVVRTLAICRAVGAKAFVNAIGGLALYDREEFSRNGVSLHFLKSRPCVYPQGTSCFHPDLSIIDVLMNCGRLATHRLLDAYDLI
jgi:WbqC-like protein family